MHFAGNDETLCDVLQRCFVQKQVVVLEHERRFAAQTRNLFFGDLIEFEFFVIKNQGAAVGFFEEVYAAQEGCFTGAGRADDGNHIALLHVKIDAAQHMQLAEGFFNVQNLQHNSALLVSVRRELLFAKALHPSEHRGENEVYKADLKV